MPAPCTVASARATKCAASSDEARRFTTSAESTCSWPSGKGKAGWWPSGPQPRVVHALGPNHAQPHCVKLAGLYPLHACTPKLTPAAPRSGPSDASSLGTLRKQSSSVLATKRGPASPWRGSSAAAARHQPKHLAMVLAWHEVDSNA